MTSFNPNKLTFDDGLKRIEKAVKKSGLKLNGKILTSRDEGMSVLIKSLQTSNVPKGFAKFQLPVALDRAQLFMTSAPPNAKVPHN